METADDSAALAAHLQGPLQGRGLHGAGCRLPQPGLPSRGLYRFLHRLSEA